MSREAQKNTSGSLILGAVRCRGLEIGYRQLLSLSIVFVENQVSDSCQHILGIGIVIRVGRLSPECILVELDGIFGDTAAHHSSESTVTERERLFPIGCRAVVPQTVLAVKHGGRHRTLVGSRECHRICFRTDVSGKV